MRIGILLPEVRSIKDHCSTSFPRDAAPPERAKTRETLAYKSDKVGVNLGVPDKSVHG